MKGPRVGFDGRMLILFVILVLGTGASQVVYRSSIEAMHHSLLTAIETAEVVHAAENFHSSIHSMLLLVGPAQATQRSQNDAYITQREQARSTLRILSTPPVMAIGDLEGVYSDFETFLDILQTQGAVSGEQWEKAEKLYDALFQIYLEVLHTYHDGRLEDMKAQAHQLDDQTNLLFWVQLGFLVASVLLALLFTFLTLFKPFQIASRQAFHDGLTGLANRRYWDKKLVPEIETRIRSGLPFSLCLMDVDHFKHFNDTYGHPAGDTLLKTLSRTIREEVRSSDEIVRFGGEEFLFVLWGTQTQQAVEIIEKVRLSVERVQITVLNETSVGATASFGIATYPVDSMSATDLLEIADQRLYQAKMQGRNRIEG